MNRVLRPLLVFCLLSSCWLPSLGQQPTLKTTESAKTVSIGELRMQAMRSLQRGDWESAEKAADAIIKSDVDNDPSSMRLAADVYLRTGRVDLATRWFERYLELVPDALPGLWQRGIALYFAGDYKRGAEQFEEHRRVNPHDVENAAWHFLCVAKAESPEKARVLLLPAPHDPRVPMVEVLRMLGNGDTEAVERRVAKLEPGSSARRDAAFYGDFYLGLYADALGDNARAHRYLARAAKEAPRHYMGDVARVYAKHLEPKSQVDRVEP